MATLLLFITWFLTLITFGLGYLLGYFLHSKEVGKPMEIKLPKFLKKKYTLGSIPKLSQIQLEKKGTKLAETEQAMEETLKEIL